MAEITKFEIDMLDVKAADAFLIHAYRKGTKGQDVEYVVLVDAGNEGDGEKILNHIQKYYDQQYIDLVIITHCDADHYGGMQYLINKHSEGGDFSIKKVWVHDPYQHVDVDDVKYIRKEKTLRDRLNAAYAFSDGTNLLDLLDESDINRKEVFSGDTYAPLNIKVLGPDEDYYESLIPDFRVDLDFKEEQPEDVYAGLECFCQTEDQFLSKALEDAYDDKSKVNQSSIIFEFCPKDKLFLFTGDAGREALHRIIDEDSEDDSLFKNIYWLKVPHHGSKHNLDNAIISHLHPTLSYISTEKYGKYANKCTVNALKKVGKVYSTQKKHQSIWYHDGTNDREDYSTAETM